MKMNFGKFNKMIDTIKEVTGCDEDVAITCTGDLMNLLVESPEDVEDGEQVTQMINALFGDYTDDDLPF